MAHVSTGPAPADGWQVLVQDVDHAAVAALRDSQGVSDFEDVPVTLEEVYAALMARSTNGTAAGAANGGHIPMVRRASPN